MKDKNELKRSTTTTQYSQLKAPAILEAHTSILTATALNSINMRHIPLVILFLIMAHLPLTAQTKQISITPKLGAGFGKIIEIEGTITDDTETRQRAHLGKKLIKVRQVGGKKLKQPSIIELYTFSFSQIKIPRRGAVVKLRGYESGGFKGIPNEAFKDIPTVSTSRHSFKSWFQVTKVLNPIKQKNIGSIVKRIDELPAKTNISVQYEYDGKGDLTLTLINIAMNAAAQGVDGTVIVAKDVIDISPVESYGKDGPFDSVGQFTIRYVIKNVKPGIYSFTHDDSQAEGQDRILHIKLDLTKATKGKKNIQFEEVKGDDPFE